MDAFDDIDNEERRLLLSRMEDEWPTTCGSCGGTSEARVDTLDRSLMVLLVVLLFALGIGFLALEGRP